ncbi:MAG: Bifunctional hemolysin/adenylate cyclase precursor [Verrucomicrobiota bacterium]|jgi:hypothetical protein
MNSPCIALSSLLLLVSTALAGPPFAEFVDPNPNPGNEFGRSVVPLSTGNVVITSPFDDFGGTDAGAVYLFNGATGALISTLRGSKANDIVGFSGVTALSNGNYVVGSPGWDNGAAINAGAATWCNGTTGINGVVSSSNSLVGTTSNDNVGNKVVALSNGNYVVTTSNWDNGATTQAGAVTWGSGTTGISGPVSSSNSLVGTSSNDLVGGNGSNGVIPLSNGHYVVCSQYWDNGSFFDAGAVTWGNGTTGISGVVTSSNSLVGGKDNDRVGSGAGIVFSSFNRPGAKALSNGHYVVISPLWDNGSTDSAGAVTWCDGTTGRTGLVTSSNSLVGSQAEDNVGGDDVTLLSNGHYVVSSPTWDNATVFDAGAVTWCDGASGLTGAVSTSNSLVGNAGDYIASGVGAGSGGGVIALTNGNYVVRSPNFKNGAVNGAGAVTWCNGSSSITGTVTTSNSLVGTTQFDNVGWSGVIALTNGHYVVCSSDWDLGAVSNAGAATWGDGTTGIIGTVTTSNSLVGSTANDRVGYGAKALTNGNYVVTSPQWNNGAVAFAGAVTWGNGAAGTTGTVSIANSLVGTTSFEAGTVTPLSNGHYVVHTAAWDNGATPNVGAVTWCDGTTGRTGTPSISNSLIGSTANDNWGQIVTAFSNGNYVAFSQLWDNGAQANVGAATWVNGATGSTGIVSSGNSLVGVIGSTNFVQDPVVADNVNFTYLVRFLYDGAGRVRVGSQVDGLGAPSPEIAVEQPAATNLISGSASISFGTRPAGNASAAKVFTIRNTGDAELTLTAPAVSGGNAGDFAVNNTGLLLTVPAAGQTTFSVIFTPGGGGARTTTLSIGNNDANESPFTIALTGSGLVTTNDTDSDGLNDVAEFNFAALGFDWQTSQPALVTTLMNGASSANLYTTGQIQALNINTPLLTRNPTTGVFTLTIGIQKSTTLESGSFVHFPFTPIETSINGAGKVEFQFTSPDNAAFFRLQAQ